MTSDKKLTNVQLKCCAHYGAAFLAPSRDQLVAISPDIYESVNPVEGVRYNAPDHMSGWWLTTDSYDGNVSSLITVHFEHIVEKRPELAVYMALPPGYRFLLGGKEEHVWFDSEVAEKEQ